MHSKESPTRSEATTTLQTLVTTVSLQTEVKGIKSIHTDDIIRAILPFNWVWQ